MVMATEQESVSDVGAAVVAVPLVDVMRLAPGGRAIAARKAAATVSHGETDPLTGGEEPLTAADVDDLALRVEMDRDRAAVADFALDRRETERHALALDETEAGAPGEVMIGDDDPHRGALSAHDLGCRGRADADELDERVDRQLLRGAFVALEAFGVIARRRIDEARTAATR